MLTRYINVISNISKNINPYTGEIIAEKGEKISAEKADIIERAGVNSVDIIIEGQINSLVYSASDIQKKNGGILNKIFK